MPFWTFTSARFFPSAVKFDFQFFVAFVKLMTNLDILDINKDSIIYVFGTISLFFSRSMQLLHYSALFCSFRRCTTLFYCRSSVLSIFNLFFNLSELVRVFQTSNEFFLQEVLTEFSLNGSIWLVYILYYRISFFLGSF